MQSKTEKTQKTDFFPQSDVRQSSPLSMAVWMFTKKK